MKFPTGFTYRKFEIHTASRGFPATARLLLPLRSVVFVGWFVSMCFNMFVIILGAEYRPIENGW